MADTEFEEFRKTFERLPSYTSTKTTAPTFYSIVPNLDDESPTSNHSKSDESNDDEVIDLKSVQLNGTTVPTSSSSLSSPPSSTTQSSKLIQNAVSKTLASLKCSLQGNTEDDEIGDGLRTTAAMIASATPEISEFSQQNGYGTQQQAQTLLPFGKVERRRRKLPEIPTNRKSSIILNIGQTSLADELTALGNQQQQQQSINSTLCQRQLLARKCGYILDEDSSPDSDRLHSLGDVDSGHSTAHSPTDLKSLSPQLAMSPTTSTSFQAPFGGVPYSQLEMLESTHRGIYKFNPRHCDEIDIEIGDPIYVQKEADDLWCEGVNLRTGRQGIFPSAYAVDLEYNDFDPTAQKVKKERYLLGYMGSVETMAHKGTGVVCQAVRKIVGECGESPNVQVCILEISDQGLRMVERASSNKDKKRPCIDYFYSLKNVSFCAFHPRDHRYIGFITKHPTIQRFACHVFKGQESTRPVAEAVGRAFQRFYQKFIETAYPIEDIYIE